MHSGSNSAAFQYVREGAPPARPRPARELAITANAFKASGDITTPLYVKVENLEGSLPLAECEAHDISISCELRVGDVVIGVQRTTSSIPRAIVPRSVTRNIARGILWTVMLCSVDRWDEILSFGVLMKDLPSTATLHVRSLSSSPVFTAGVGNMCRDHWARTYHGCGAS